MASLRMLSRRIRRILSSKVVSLCGICIFLFLGIQWVILHNHDTSSASPIRPRPTARLNSKQINWDRYRYVQYVTTERSLCSSSMIWDEILEIGSRAKRIMLYPSNWDVEEKVNGEHTPIARMLQQAQKKYSVKLQPLDALVQNTPESEIWAEPYTNLLAFNMTEYDRVVAIDSSSMVRHNLDELFLIPSTPLAMPYVYFGGPDDWQFSSQLMIITPSARSFSRIAEAVNGSQFMEHDTAILEKLFYGQIIKIPQRPFALMSGEYRRASHDIYIGNRFPKVWDPDRIMSEARILHFSDYPLPKPWDMASRESLNRHMPKCKLSEWFGATDCKDREVWTNIYREYRDKRQTVCGAGFEAVLKEGPTDKETARATTRILHLD